MLNRNYLSLGMSFFYYFFWFAFCKLACLTSLYFMSSAAGIPKASARCLNSTPFHAFGGLQHLECELNLEVFESKVNVCIYIFEIELGQWLTFFTNSHSF